MGIIITLMMEFHFNTQSIASKMINYKDAYVLLHIECEIPFDETDQGKKSIPKLLYLKNSFEIVKNLKVQLNNVTILNEGNVNRSALIDFVLDNPQSEPLMYRNIKKASSDGLNITDNKFITKDTYFTNRRRILMKRKIISLILKFQFS